MTELKNPVFPAAYFGSSCRGDRCTGGDAQRYESGDIKNIKHETILSLASLFSVSPAYLMGWTDEPYVHNEKEAAPKSEDGLSPLDIQLTDLLRFLTDDQKKLLLAQIETLLKSQQ
jgi:transcriptional regulator with XRE-family HTH domain